jgi:hypothetical protein
MDKIRRQSKVRHSIKASPGEKFARVVGCGERSKLFVILRVDRPMLYVYSEGTLDRTYQKGQCCGTWNNSSARNWTE